MTHENVHTATELLTLTETAAVLRTTVATLRYWRHLGVGPDGFRLGRRVVYRRGDVDRWLTEQQQAQFPRREGHSRPLDDDALPRHLAKAGYAAYIPPPHLVG